MVFNLIAQQHTIWSMNAYSTSFHLGNFNHITGIIVTYQICLNLQPNILPSQ